MNSAAFTVLTNKLNNLSPEEAYKVIDYIKNVENELIDKARSVCKEFEYIDSSIVYSSTISYVKVECGNYVDERRIIVSEVLFGKPKMITLL